MIHKSYFISKETGELLMSLIKLSNAKNILEIGSGEGYSTIFLARAARATKGKVTSIEKHEKSCKKCLSNLKKAKLEKFVKVINKPALEVLPKLKQKFDFVFIDEGHKEDYIKDLKAILKKLNKPCMVVAHNAISHKVWMKDYLKFVRKNFNSTLLPFDKGIEVSLSPN